MYLKSLNPGDGGNPYGGTLRLSSSKPNLKNQDKTQKM
jgi:hypothetical protein